MFTMKFLQRWAVAAACAFAFFTSADARAPLRGEPAPDFRLQVLGGGELALSDLRGKVVLIDFFGYG